MEYSINKKHVPITKFHNKISINAVPDILTDFDDNYVDVTLTSPPFYDDELYVLDGGKIEFGWKTYQEYQEHLSQVFKELLRITKPGGKVILVLSNSPKINSESYVEYYWPCLHDLLSECHKLGWILIDEIVWIHNQPVYETYSKTAPNARLNPFHNWISILEKPGNEAEEVPTLMKQNSVWYIDAEGPISEYNQSYGSFPNDLIEKSLNLWSNEGDIVLDPYAGSGQTVRVAMEMKRIGIGFEVDRKWEHLWIDINEQTND
ncbi:MAG: site-specific DNA-methyltransferase [Candidatus Heimdallarchaeota archaeon]|nr:site-specific DNA-methyltransferase [Candidatus Heimdallarchaeota archaeon]